MTRLLEFMSFEDVVEGHIENYTIPQYGCAPDDPVTEWTPSQCADSIKRYCSRLESNARGRQETLRDMAKIAHFACLIFWKLKPTEDEMCRIKEGRL